MTSPTRPLYIHFCGLDGAGKSQAILSAQTVLSEHGVKPLLCREPGGTPIAESLRSVVKDDWTETVSPKTELALMYAAREQIYTNVIIPTLQSGVSCLQDRSWACSYAYQLCGHNAALSEKDFFSMHDIFMHNKPKPDLVFLLDVDPSIGIARTRGRGALDRIENNTLAFFERARAGYLLLANQYDSWRVINANRSLDDVTADIQSQVLALLEYKRQL